MYYRPVCNASGWIVTKLGSMQGFLSFKTKLLAFYVGVTFPVTPVTVTV